MLDIHLSASFESWKLFWLRRRHPKFKELAKKIFARDLYTCQYCGIAGDEETQFNIVNEDNNYQNNKVSNLQTACPICAQCFFLESIGTGAFGGGILIYLPEMSQNQLNAFTNEIFLAQRLNSKEASTGDGILRDLKFRSSDVEKVFGDGMSDPARFGNLILTAQLSSKNLEKVMQPLRLLAVKSRFSDFTESLVKSREETAVPKEETL